jgi:outer membrane protein assembly complex protein YaeT
MSVRRPYWGCLLALAVALAGGPAAAAADSPAGRIVARVIPVDNRSVKSDYILAQMHTRPGKPYDEATVAADVRRLLNTRLFTADGVQISTSIGTDGQVTVFVRVKELSAIVREVVFLGAQHLSESELLDMTRVRRGSPLNPAMNKLDAQSILNKLREDGRAYASVTLLEGDKLTDSRVVFQIVEGPVVHLRGVEFRGNRQASGGRLRTQVVSTGPLIPGLVTPLSPKFTPAVVEEDKKRLETYYRKLGHLDMMVREEVVPSPSDPSEVTVVYHIHEGQPYTVREVRIDGNKTVPEERLRKVTAIKPGERYDLEVATADEQRLSTLYGNQGYQTGIRHATFVVPDRPGAVDVHYLVEEPAARAQGPREPDRVGRIIIEGNTITDQRVILNQLGLYPGQILQYPKLREAELNLMRLGIFDPEDPPRVVAVASDFDSVYKDVRVRVKETRTGMIAATANVNSDAGVNGSIVLNQRNFDILRVPTSLDDLFAGKAFRGGGQELRVEAMPGTVFQRYAVTWREPYLFDSRFGLTGSGYYYNRAFAEYNEDRYGGRFTLDYRLGDTNIWRANVGSRIEGVNIKDIPYWASRAIWDDAGQSTVVGVSAGLTRDTRDSFLLPTKGSIFDVRFEQIFGDYQFPIGTMEGSAFFTMYERKDGSGKHVLAARSQLAVAGGNAPVFERFYAGGFRSLRGFSFRGVGPYENNLNIGGTFAFLNSFEYKVPILANDRLWAVAFVDHGTVETGVKITDYRVSVGAGLRIVVPALGPLPIALDFAVPLHQGPFDNKQLFSFYVGWFGGQ